MENNYINMILQSDNILVKELQDDLKVNGVVSMYDGDNPYMFCSILNASDEAKEKLNLDDITKYVLVIKRYAKEEYLADTYFISYKDVRAILTIEDYNKMSEE